MNLGLKKGKKAQLTVYIIIAIVIIGLIIFLLLAKQGKIIEPKETFDQASISLQERITKCLENSTQEALFLIGMQGGYTEPLTEEELSFPTIYAYVPYYYNYYYSPQNLLPKEDEIKNQISLYIKKNIDSCINFNSFRNFFKITRGNKKISVEFTENQTKVNLYYPITLEKKGLKIKISDFSDVENVRIKPIYESSKEIIEKTILRPDQINIEKILELEEKYNLQIDSFVFNNQIVVYRIEDNSSKLRNSNYFYFFAVKTIV